MPKITTATISEFRVKLEYDVSVTECKKMLEETAGNISKSIALLRERGLLVETNESPERIAFKKRESLPLLMSVIWIHWVKIMKNFIGIKAKNLQLLFRFK
jgi:hypothetical protein